MTLQAPRERVLLYDGVCGLCNRAVRFVLEHDPAGALMFAPLGGEYAAAMLARHPEVKGIDSVVLVTRYPNGTDEVAVRSEAAISIAEYLGGGWTAARMLRGLPRGLRDGAYDLVARGRYRIFGRYDSCPVPPEGVRQRFIP